MDVYLVLKDRLALATKMVCGNLINCSISDKSSEQIRICEERREDFKHFI